MFTEKQIIEISDNYSCGEDNLSYAFADGFKKCQELIKLPTVDDYIKWCAPSIHKNEAGDLFSKEWIDPECQEDFDLFEEFMNEWVSKLSD